MIVDHDLGRLVNLEATGTVTGTDSEVPNLTMKDILVINRGALPPDINPTEVRQTFTGDERAIIDAKPDRRVALGRTPEGGNKLSPLDGVSFGPTDATAPLNQEHRVSKGSYVEVATFRTRQVQVTQTTRVPIPPLQIAQGGITVNTQTSALGGDPINPQGFQQMGAFLANAAQNGSPAVNIQLRLAGLGATQLNPAAVEANLRTLFIYSGQINVTALPAAVGQGSTTVSSPGGTQQVTQTTTQTQRIQTGTKNQLQP